MLKCVSHLVLPALLMAAIACSSDRGTTPPTATVGTTAISPSAPSPVPPTPAPLPTRIPEPTVVAVPPPRAVVFPDDEGSHGDQLEWWYYNGHLLGDDGSEWGFHFVIFQARQPGLPTAYVGQLGLTDVGSGDHIEESTFFLQADAGRRLNSSSKSYGRQTSSTLI